MQWRRKLKLQNRISTPQRQKDDFEALFKRNFKKTIISAKIEKICWQITFAALMQPFQYDLRSSAAKDNSITNEAAALSNLDAATTMRSAETQLQNTMELRAMASEIEAPKPDLDVITQIVLFGFVSAGFPVEWHHTAWHHKSMKPATASASLAVITGEAPFCAPAFSYVVRTKKGPLLCHTSTWFVTRKAPCYLAVTWERCRTKILKGLCGVIGLVSSSRGHSVTFRIVL